MTSALRIEIVRQTDGTVVLRCTRHDGSVTWQHQRGTQAAFFPLHDLTHFAVETELGVRDGFFGLIVQGWSIDETTGKGARGAIPPAATLVERLVGLLDVERATGVRPTAEELRQHIVAAERRLAPLCDAHLTQDALDRVRARRSELFAAWAATASGTALTLEFA